MLGVIVKLAYKSAHYMPLTSVFLIDQIKHKNNSIQIYTI